MRYGGLFEGIGGFALAAQWMNWQNRWSVEIDPFCCQVLRKNFNHQIIENDIRKCGIGRAINLSAVDIICGGFPCQPFSIAGQRKGTTDDRYLWDEMLRIILEIQPTWVVAENVAGITSMGKPIGTSYLESETIAFTEESMVLSEICESLEEAVYRVQPIVIPACAVQAPHRRDRVWIIAQNANKGFNGKPKTTRDNAKLRDTGTANEVWLDSDHAERTDGRYNGKEENRQKQEFRKSVGTTADTDTDQKRRKGQGELGKQIRSEQDEKRKSHITLHDNQFQSKWYEVAAQFCRVDDGLPNWMDRADRTKIYKLVKLFGREAIEKETALDLSKVDPWRKKRLESLGNAIVPQVAYQIFKAIQNET